jgi:glucose-6-phosphate 1-dehydrogenase
MECDLLIIGGDGDLAYRKLYPALYRLDVAGHLPASANIVAIARSDLSNDGAFVEKVKTNFSALANQAIDEIKWSSFSRRLHYRATDATDISQFSQLKAEYFNDPDRDLIVYLATPPSIFTPVCRALGEIGLVRPNTRIVVEKPLGESRDSFLLINQSLTSVFNEQQVFRIDHYLGKETVQNLLALRFANALFEPVWNNNYIDHVQITVAETVGIEGRWGFYDEAGAMRDMVQNHLLQLLCLVAMEPPAQLEARAVHDEKLKVLRSLKPMSKAEVLENTVRGQYTSGAIKAKAVPGYLEEEGAHAGSGTETFVALKAEVYNWRWSSVPFYLRTGKRMMRRSSEIVIQFKDVPHRIFGEPQTGNAPNRLVIRLQPDEGIHLQLLNKVPGLEDPMMLEPVILNLSLSDAFTDRSVPDAYERLLFDVMRNNSTLFMRSDQLEAAWIWVDKIIEAWQRGKKKVSPYPAGSWGPSDSIALIAKDGRAWFEG